jgi:hypothetical protein
MTQEARRGVFGDHPFSVVGNPDDAAPAILDVDGDLCGACVEGVFDEFFYDRCGTFNNFSGSDAVGDVVRQNTDARHREKILAVD